jgi:hypothetical protein
MARHHDLHQCAAPPFGMVMPGVPKTSDAHDRIVDITPVKLVLGRQLLRRRIADDQVSDPQGLDHEPNLGRAYDTGHPPVSEARTTPACETSYRLAPATRWSTPPVPCSRRASHRP